MRVPTSRTRYLMLKVVTKDGDFDGIFVEANVIYIREKNTVLGIVLKIL